MNDVAVKVAELPEKHDILINGTAFSPDGKYIAIESEGVNINIWDWRDQRIVKTIEMPRGSNNGMEVNPLSYSPDGKLFASCVGGGVGNVFIRVWNTVNWTIAHDITDSGPGLCTEMAFTPDGNQILYIANRGMPPDDLTAYTVGTWTKTWNLQLEGQSASFAIRSDGRMAVIAGGLKRPPGQVLFNRGLSIINLQQQRVVREIASNGKGPVVWSPDGKRIGLAGVDIQIFDAESGQKLIQATWENSSHRNICFTPDAKYFIESDMNGRGNGQGVRIWDSERFKLLQEIHGNIKSLSVTRDSSYLALSDTGRTTIWQLK